MLLFGYRAECIKSGSGVIPMLGNLVADIVVLGILHRSSVSQERVIAVAKSIVPDLWCPTSDFIRGAIVRNIKLGLLTETITLPHMLLLTKAGEERFQVLMAFEIDVNESPSFYAYEAIQFCFLDNALPNTVKTILEHRYACISERLAELQKRYNGCPNNGHFTRLWVGMERRNLEAKAEIISEACRICSIEFSQSNQKIPQ